MKKICSLFCIGLIIFVFANIHPNSVYATIPSISSISVSDTTSSSAKITWTTDISSTSVVEYGTDDSYGSSTDDATLTTSHSITLSGLSSSTTYHFKVTSLNSGDAASSGDQTFSTSSTSSSTTTTTTTKIITATPLPSPTPDKVPPSVNLKTDFSKNYKEAPVVSGSASDVSGVASLEYSIDNGKNWLPVGEIASIYGKSTSFSFALPALFDGSYNIKIRSQDGKGNAGVTRAYTLTIDRLPPRVGSYIVKSGPLILETNLKNPLPLLKNEIYTLFLSAVGGPNSINLYPRLADQNKLLITPFPMYIKNDLSLWQTEVKFANVGSYLLETTSKDGAGNITEKSLGSVFVVPRGVISDGTSPIEDVEISLYSLDNITGKYTLWDPSSYGIKNPVKTDKSGEYSFLLPAGSYYLSLKKTGFENLRSRITILPASSYINSDFTLKKRKKITLGNFTVFMPQLISREANLNQKSGTETKAPLYHDLINNPLPDFILNTAGGEINQFTFRADPSLIVFLNTFSPQSSDILSVLENLTAGFKIIKVIVAPQESQESVTVFKNRGGYKLPIFADPDGNLLELLKLSSLPTYIFIDRFGVITDIRTGFLTSEEIIKILAK